MKSTLKEKEIIRTTKKIKLLFRAYPERGEKYDLLQIRMQGYISGRRGIEKIYEIGLLYI